MMGGPKAKQKQEVGEVAGKEKDVPKKSEQEPDAQGESEIVPQKTGSVEKRKEVADTAGGALLDRASPETKEATEAESEALSVEAEDVESVEDQRRNARITERERKYLDAFSSLDQAKLAKARDKYAKASKKDILCKTSRDLLYSDVKVAEGIEADAEALKKEFDLCGEADLLRMAAYVELPPREDGFYVIKYPENQEMSVGFGEFIPKEIMQIEYKPADGSEAILAYRGEKNGRICFLDERGQYVASYSGDRVKLLPPGEEKEISGFVHKDLPHEEAELHKYYYDLLLAEQKTRSDFEKMFAGENDFVKGYENEEGYVAGVPIRGLENIAQSLRENTPVDLGYYMTKAQKAKAEGKAIKRENCAGIDFNRFSRYGVDKGPFYCATFVSEVLGIRGSEGSIRNLFPRILAGVEESAGTVEATNSYRDMKEGSVYALLFYEEGPRKRGGKWLSHIALASKTTINGSPCIVAAHEGALGASIVVTSLAGPKPSSEAVAAHLRGNSNAFLAKMGAWYDGGVHKDMRISENKGNMYWSDKGDKKDFQMAVNIDSIVG